MKNLNLIILASLLLVIMHCSSETTVNEANIFNQTRTPQAIILDFYNTSGLEQYNTLGTLIADRLYNDLRSEFILQNMSVVRNFVRSRNLSREDLNDIYRATEIGNEFNADVVIKGSYGVLGNEVQVMVEFVPISEGVAYQTFDYIISSDEAFSDLEEMADELASFTIQNVPPIVESNKEDIEEAAVQSVENPMTMRSIAESFVSGEGIDPGLPVDLNFVEALYENPVPMPAWIDNLPVVEGKMYFIGQSFYQADYYAALELAMKDAFMKISEVITQVIIGEEELDENSDLVRAVLSNMLPLIQGSELEKETYIMYSDERKFYAAILYGIDRQIFQNHLSNAISQAIYELNNNVNEINNQLVQTADPEQRAQLESMIAEVQNAVAELNTMNQDTTTLLTNIESENARIQEESTDTTEIEITSELQMNNLQQNFLGIIAEGRVPNYHFELGIRAGYPLVLGDYSSELDSYFMGSLVFRYNPGLLDGLVGEFEASFLPFPVKDTSQASLTGIGVGLGPRYTYQIMEFFGISGYLNAGAMINLHKDELNGAMSTLYTFLFKAGIDFEFLLAYHSSASIGVNYQSSFAGNSLQSLNIYGGYNYRIGGVREENQLQMTEPHTIPIFPVLSSRLVTAGALGSIKLTNTGDKPITNIQVAVYMGRYMENPTMISRVYNLSPEDNAIIVPLSAVVNDNILVIGTDRYDTAEIVLRYNIDGVAYTKRETINVFIHGKNAITWSPVEKVCAFVSPDDPGIVDLRSALENQFTDDNLSSVVNRNIKKAMRAFAILKSFGLDYQSDPARPFSTSSSSTGQEAIDTIQFPSEFLNATRRTGDCDDCAVLYASLLEAVGVPAGFLITSQHIFSMFSTGVSENDVNLISDDPNKVIIIDGEVWVPVETTFIDKDRGGFMEAWQMALEEYRTNQSNIDQVIVREAWEDYSPTALSSGSGGIVFPSYNQADQIFHDEVEQYLSTSRQSIYSALSTDYSNLSEAEKRQAAINLIRSSSFELAIPLLSEIAGDGIQDFQDYYYLGTAYLQTENNQQALDSLLAALQIAQSDANFANYIPMIYINIALSYYNMGNSSEQLRYYNMANELNPSLGYRYNYLSNAE